MHPDMIYSFFGGGFAFTVASYAAKTIPQPQNPWALWIIGIVQFILANKYEGKQNFEQAKLQQSLNKDQ